MILPIIYVSFRSEVYLKSFLDMPNKLTRRLVNDGLRYHKFQALDRAKPGSVEEAAACLKKVALVY
jgi:hypothetical protein